MSFSTNLFTVKNMSVASHSIMQKIMIKFISLWLCLSVANQGIVEATISVIEVPAGHLAELACLSSDDYHRFMFWQLTNDNSIIGPGNRMDEEKYNYEVLTGKLFIRGVSPNESGFYKCFAMGLEDNSAINVHVVQLIVKGAKNTDNSFETNLLIGMVVAMIIVVGIALALLIFVLKRRRTQRFFDLMESRENSPAKYVGTIQSAPVTPAPRTMETGGIDNFGMDVDFTKAFQQTSQQGSTLPL